MTVYHLNRKVGNEELVKEVENVINTLYDEKVRPLEEEVNKIKSIVLSMKGTDNKFDENERIKDLTKYALSLVNLDNEKDGLGCCKHCYAERGRERERTSCRSVMIESNKMVYGERCTSYWCKNKFYKLGEIPISIEAISLMKDTDTHLHDGIIYPSKPTDNELPF